MIQQQPRVKLLSHTNQQIQYQQFSSVFKFKDIITVQFNSINKTQSSIYIYSYSTVGYWDFGVNCRRVKSWLQQLQHQINGF